MKRKILLSLLLTLLLLTPSITALAGYYTPVKTEIELKINEGGTAVIVPEVNCPVPDKTELNLGDGETGKYYIYFDEVGVYTYTVKAVPDKRDLIFDDRVYTVKVYVTDENGKLAATTVVYTPQGKYSADVEGAQLLLFRHRKEETPEPPTEEETRPPSDGTTSSHKKNRNPKTGDDSKMEQYFVIAMIASAGLLVLSVIYLIDTEKMIKRNEE